LKCMLLFNDFLDHHDYPSRYFITLISCIKTYDFLFIKIKVQFFSLNKDELDLKETF